MVDAEAPYPLPRDPDLATVSAALRDGGNWAVVVDSSWRVAYVTDDLRSTFAAGRRLAPFALGEHFFGSASLEMSRSWRMGLSTTELYSDFLEGLGGWVLADTPGGRDELRAVVDPSLRDVVDGLEPADAAGLFFAGRGMGLGRWVGIHASAIRVRDQRGRVAGTAIITKPAVSMATVGALIAMEDPDHIRRMQAVAVAARRPAAILFADLEGSSPLARRLSTVRYFSVGRRLVRAFDQCVVDAGGLVGRHVGDGVVAFFLAETLGSESAAARACIETARALVVAVGPVAERSGLDAEAIGLRFGMHWGSTLYVGNITTAGRSEVTALGDEVNETARIEACATGGRMLASKHLLERLVPGDAAAVGLDPDATIYTALADLSTATEKARRDAPVIAVADLVTARRI